MKRLFIACIVVQSLCGSIPSIPISTEQLQELLKSEHFKLLYLNMSQIPHVTVSVPFIPNFKMDQQAQLLQYQNQHQQVQITMPPPQPAQPMSEIVAKYIEQAKNQSTSFVAKHTMALMFGSIAATYAGMLYLVMSGNSYCQAPDLWCMWHAEMGDDLLEVPQQDLAQALVKDIQGRYVNPKNPTDFITPLMQFVKDLEEETKWLNRYYTLYNWLVPLGGEYLFPFEEESYGDLDEKIARLAYIKNIYYSWIAEYKIVQSRMSRAHDLYKTSSAPSLEDVKAQ